MTSLDSLKESLRLRPYAPSGAVFKDLDSKAQDEFADFACDLVKQRSLVFSKFIQAHGYLEKHFLSHYLGDYGLSLLQTSPSLIFSILQTNQVLLPHVLFANTTAGDSFCVILKEPLDSKNQNDLKNRLREVCPAALVEFFFCESAFWLEIDFALRLKHALEEDEVQDGLVVGLVSLAILYGASDVHISIEGGLGRIALRVDGTLVRLATCTKNLFERLTQTLKLLCKVDITQKRRPQDGHFSLENLFSPESVLASILGAATPRHESCDVRLSCFPDLDQESLVLRLPNYSKNFHGLDSMNLDASVEKTLRRHLLAKSGLVLVSGPTGSGKSTLLYNGLRLLNDGTRKLITIEDPIEQEIQGVTQCQVGANLDFSLALKHMLRQDPDALMIGEIRDKATMDSALRATLTGHLVLASLHAHDGVGSLARLRDLGAKEYVLESTLSCIISQRLLKSLCAYCKEDGENGAIARGCARCHYKGFGARILIQEILDSSHIACLLRGDRLEGFVSLKDRARALFEEGLICYEESLL